MEIFYFYPPLALAQAAFMIWMLVDAHRGRADAFWFYVILFIPVIGAWAYFFTVKAPQLHASGGLSRVGTLFQRRVSVEELRFRAEQTPSLSNRFALADRLIECEEFAEALPHLEAVRDFEPGHCQVLYSLACCHWRLGHPERAIPLLENLISRNASWSDYAAWYTLIRAREDRGDRAGATESCRDLAKRAPTLKNYCLLAEHLLAGERAGEAREVLDQALRHHAFAPWPIRRRNRAWVRAAHRLQKQIPIR